MQVDREVQRLIDAGAIEAAIRRMHGRPLPAVSAPLSARTAPRAAPAVKTDQEIASEALSMSRAEGISVVDALKRMGIKTWPRPKASR